MIGFVSNVFSAKSERLTQELLDSWLDSMEVEHIHKMIENGDVSKKNTLPGLMPHALSSTGGRTDKEMTEMTNCVLLDYDNHGDWQTFWDKVKDNLEEYNILFCERTCRDGIHCIVPLIKGFTINQTQAAWAEFLGLELDMKVKSISQKSFLSPRRKNLYVSNRLFEAIEPVDAPFSVGLMDVAVATATNISRTGSEATALTSQAETNVAQQDYAATFARMQDVHHYKGIDYADIIRQLLLRMGIDGSPVEGERNSTLYALARELRYICDFNPQRIIENLPVWGLTEAEVSSTVRSAVNSTRKEEMPENLKQIVTYLEKDTSKITDTMEMEEWEEIPLHLPERVKQIVDKYPDDFKPAVLATLPCLLGTLTTNLRAYYLDNAEHSTSLLTCVVAPQASGKSYTRTLYDILMAPIKDADNEYRKLEKNYKKAVKRARQDQELPEEPENIIRLLPPSTSNAVLLKRADLSNNKHLFIFTEELDSLLKSEKAGAWSQKSDLYRKAFDNAEFGQDYMSDNSYSGVVKIYLNLLTCCTPRAMRKFFSNTEDGTTSRFTYIMLPDNLGSDIPTFGHFSREERKEIYNWAQSLMEIKGEDEEERWVECQQLDETIKLFLKEKREEYLADQSHPSLDIFRRRAAVIGWRTGLIAYAIEDFRWTPAVGDWAYWMAEYTLQMQLRLWGEELDKIMNDNQQQMQEYQQKQKKAGVNNTLFDELPDHFSADDISNALYAQGREIKNTRYIVSRWVKADMCRKLGPGQWVKTEAHAKNPQ